MKHLNQFLPRLRASDPAKERFYFLDLIRGLTLISMILFHGSWDLVYLYGKRIPGYTGTPGYLWQQSICWSFILLSGMAANLGGSSPKHQLKRGLLLSACGIIVSIVTMIAEPDDPVIMGVLSFYGLAVLVLIPFRKFLDRVPTWLGLILSVLLFVLTRDVSDGYLGFESLHLMKLPTALYRGIPMMLLGFPWPGFYSSDYFALLPWIFLYLTGMFLGRPILTDKAKAPALLKKSFCAPIELLGRHTLIIYMLHQPLLMGVFLLFL